MKDYQYIFIIGAAKCGTTALADLMDQVDDVCLSYPKEPDFFTNRVFSKGFDWYENCFSNKASQVRVDSSVSYSAGWEGSSKNIAERIFKFAPNAKIIYLMRDPIDRTWSSYWHAIRNGYKEGSFSECIKDMGSAHISASLYSKRIEDYLAFFSQENLLLLKQQDFIKHPDEVLKKVGRFIGVQDFASKINNKERKVNSSYQFNLVGRVLLIFFPLNLVKRCAHFANRHLPEFVNRWIKGLMSKQVPEIDVKEANYLKGVYRSDLDLLSSKYGLDLKTSVWWRGE